MNRRAIPHEGGRENPLAKLIAKSGEILQNGLDKLGQVYESARARAGELLNGNHEIDRRQKETQRELVAFEAARRFTGSGRMALPFAAVLTLFLAIMPQGASAEDLDFEPSGIDTSTVPLAPGETIDKVVLIPITGDVIVRTSLGTMHRSDGQGGYNQESFSTLPRSVVSFSVNASNPMDAVWDSSSGSWYGQTGAPWHESTGAGIIQIDGIGFMNNGSGYFVGTGNGDVGTYTPPIGAASGDPTLFTLNDVQLLALGSSFDGLNDLDGATPTDQYIAAHGISSVDGQARTILVNTTTGEITNVAAEAALDGLGSIIPGAMTPVIDGGDRYFLFTDQATGVVHRVRVDDGSAPVDSDGDNLTDQEELSLGTDPQNPDSDGDNLSDGDEVDIHGTDPLDVDSDNGGDSDGDEVNAGTNPNYGGDDDPDGDNSNNDADCEDDDEDIFPGAPNPSQDCDRLVELIGGPDGLNPGDPIANGINVVDSQGDTMAVVGGDTTYLGPTESGGMSIGMPVGVLLQLNNISTDTDEMVAQGVNGVGDLVVSNGGTLGDGERVQMANEDCVCIPDIDHGSFIFSFRNADPDVYMEITDGNGQPLRGHLLEKFGTSNPETFTVTDADLQNVNKNIPPICVTLRVAEDGPGPGPGPGNGNGNGGETTGCSLTDTQQNSIWAFLPLLLVMIRRRDARSNTDGIRLSA